MNSKDRVKSFSAMMEDELGKWQIKYYSNLSEEEALVDNHGYEPQGAPSLRPSP